jgi:mannose-6-phosphate isomerase-like protein (cupin superfamily)
MRVHTPLDTWFPTAASLRALKRRPREARLFPARDRGWRALVPPFGEMIALIERGLPFHIAAERRCDRTARRGRLGPALAAGKTVYVPQAHQVLPRVARLMVALRAAVMDAPRAECSFLFLVEGAGREGLGLHHDGDVESIWIQLEGRRTVTLGPPVPRGTPQDLPPARARDARYTTRALPPGSLLYLPPRTPHRVLCYERSMALSLTWGPRRRVSRARRLEALVAWDVVSGWAASMPRRSRTRVWTQVPATVSRGRDLIVAGGSLRAPRAARRLAHGLGVMADFTRDGSRALAALEERGIVGAQELPPAIVPDAARELDGWNFG